MLILFLIICKCQLKGVKHEDFKTTYNCLNALHFFYLLLQCIVWTREFIFLLKNLKRSLLKGVTTKLCLFIIKKWYENAIESNLLLIKKKIATLTKSNYYPILFLSCLKANISSCSIFKNIFYFKMDAITTEIIEKLNRHHDRVYDISYILRWGMIKWETL